MTFEDGDCPQSLVTSGGGTVPPVTRDCPRFPPIPIPDGEPDAPAKEDGAFQIAGAKGWYLVGNALTLGQDKLEFTVNGAASVVDLWIDGRYIKRATKVAGKFSFSIDIRSRVSCRMRRLRCSVVTTLRRL